MKNIIFGLVTLCLPISLLSQVKSIEDFYSKYKGIEDVTSISLSGDLLNFVFANSEHGTEEVTNKISKLRVLVMDEEVHVREKDYQQFLKSVKKDDFEELIRFKDGGEAVDFHLREEGDVITNVLITVYGKDGFVLLSVEGLFNFSDLNDLDLNIEGAEYLKQLPEKKKQIKRA